MLSQRGEKFVNKEVAAVWSLNGGTWTRNADMRMNLASPGLGAVSLTTTPSMLKLSKLGVHEYNL